jgi:hypothetical protein
VEQEGSGTDRQTADELTGSGRHGELKRKGDGGGCETRALLLSKQMIAGPKRAVCVRERGFGKGTVEEVTDQFGTSKLTGARPTAFVN